ncbi:MAG: riboflavin synthase [Desulfobacterales bacterium]|nr:riboflavin synthase [Desulfobacterales bacterium]
MFTGLVSEVGHVVGISKGPNSAKLTIGAKQILEDIKIGDSIAVNGVCLTVVSYTKDTFTVDVMPETMVLTVIHDLKSKDKVNLEPALRVGDRFGGHIVTGHIDGMGTISQSVQEDNAIRITINVSEAIRRYIIQKGSVAIDGISLTVAGIDQNSFQVSIIPLTGMETIILQKKVGDRVNIECDVIGKYVEGLLGERQQHKHSKINEDFLKSNGFI